MFRNAPALCGRLFAVSAAVAGRQGGSAAGAAAAATGAAVAANNNSSLLGAGAAAPAPAMETGILGGLAAAGAGPRLIVDLGGQPPGQGLGGKPAVKAAVDMFYKKERRFLGGCGALFVSFSIRFSRRAQKSKTPVA